MCKISGTTDGDAGSVPGARSASSDARVGHPDEPLTGANVGPSNEQEPLDVPLVVAHLESGGALSNQPRGSHFHGVPKLTGGPDLMYMDFAMFPPEDPFAYPQLGGAGLIGPHHTCVHEDVMQLPLPDFCGDFGGQVFNPTDWI